MKPDRTPTQSDATKGYVMNVELASGTRCTLVAIARSRFQALSITAQAFDHQFQLLKEVKRVERRMALAQPCTGQA